MVDLLSNGRSNKDQGGGSYGVGHLSVFKLSGLNYVLYGGIRNDEGKIAAGQTRLSTQIQYDDETNEPYFLGKNGYLIKGFKKNKGLIDLSLFDFLHDKDIPKLVDNALVELKDKLISESGSVVIIPGFNKFGGDEEEKKSEKQVAQEIIYAAAQNYFVAIQKGMLEVAVDGSQSLTAENLEVKVRESRDASTKKVRGYPSGKEAVEAFETLIHGEEYDLEKSWGRVKIYLLQQESGSKKIVICRDGMWITDAFLKPNDFYGKVNFSALVLVDKGFDTGRISGVIRDAEPEHHNEIKENLLESNKNDKRTLRKFKEDLKKRLSELLEDIDDEKRYLGFLPIPMTGKKRRKHVIKPKPKRSKIKVDIVFVSVDGKVIELNCSTKSEHDDVLFSISADSGKDESCDSYHPNYMQIVSVELDDVILEKESSSNAERTKNYIVKKLPKGNFNMKVELMDKKDADAVSFPYFFSRKAAKKQMQKQ